MSHKQPLDTLIELAQTRTDEAAKRLGVLQNAERSASQQLELLLAYRQDYATRLQAQMCRGLSAARWGNFQHFLATLDQAIARQRTAVDQASGLLERGRGEWQQQRRRLNAFDTLAERRLRLALATLAKREQRDSDERAARRCADRAAPLPH